MNKSQWASKTKLKIFPSREQWNPPLEWREVINQQRKKLVNPKVLRKGAKLIPMLKGKMRQWIKMQLMKKSSLDMKKRYQNCSKITRSSFAKWPKRITRNNFKSAQKSTSLATNWGNLQTNRKVCLISLMILDSLCLFSTSRSSSWLRAREL